MQTETLRIDTERLTIRPYEADDYDAWLVSLKEQGMRPEPTARWQGLGKTAKEHYALQLDIQNSLESLDQISVLGIFHKRLERIVGNIAIYGIHKTHLKRASVGIWIFDPYSRQGYAREALFSGIRTLIKYHNLKEVLVEAPARDERTKNLALALGMEPVKSTKVSTLYSFSGAQIH